MTHPAVKFIIDQEFDVDVISNFVDKRIDDFDFGEDRIISVHPELEKARLLSGDERLSFVKKYAELYYRAHMAEMKMTTEKMRGLWREIEERYFLEANNIFGGLDFYRPEVVSACVSITKCGVIGDEQKSFQIWYKTAGDPPEVRRHVAHEILHFYYYAYLENKGMEKLRDNWDAAEIFNVVILNLPQFIELTGKNEEGYEMHQGQFQYYQDLWKKSSGLDDYLKSVQLG